MVSLVYVAKNSSQLRIIELIRLTSLIVESVKLTFLELIERLLLAHLIIYLEMQ